MSQNLIYSLTVTEFAHRTNDDDDFRFLFNRPIFRSPPEALKGEPLGSAEAGFFADRMPFLLSNHTILKLDAFW